MIKIGEGFECVLPQMYQVLREYPVVKSIDLLESIRSELDRKEIREIFRPGARVAVGIGSRGVSKIDEMAKTVISLLKERGVHPFIVPAMGSHGNAEAEGQKDYLAGYGITEETMGVPIITSLEVTRLGELKAFDTEIPVYFDKVALGADGLIIINRIKPHTDFRGEIESGLMKMLCIGLGNHVGATTLHMYGSEGLKRLIPAAGRLILEKVPNIVGLGIVESLRKEPLAIRALSNDNLEEEEKKLLVLARENLPGLPVRDVDFLVIDEMGKEVSGAGLDTNVIGRFLIRGIEDPPYPKVKRIAVLGLTKKSGGNATGLGLADFVTQQLVDDTNLEITYTNGITSNFAERLFIPVIAESDQEAATLGLKTSRGWDTSGARVVRIKNTLALEKIEVSQAVWKELEPSPEYSLVKGPFQWSFTGGGELEGRGAW